MSEEKETKRYQERVKSRLDEIKAWARDGATEEEIAKKLGVAYSTFREYKTRNSALSAALTPARVYDDKVVYALHKNTLGGTIGANMDFAETIIQLKESYPHIRLTLTIPYSKRVFKYTKNDQQRYQKLIEKADETHILFSHYTPYRTNKCNRFIVNKSDKVLSIWNASKKGCVYNTLQYARKKEKKIEYIMLPAIKTRDFLKQQDFYIEYPDQLMARQEKDAAIERCIMKLKETTLS